MGRWEWRAPHFHYAWRAKAHGDSFVENLNWSASLDDLCVKGRSRMGNGGRGGIRTHGSGKATFDFESSALNQTQPPFQRGREISGERLGAQSNNAGKIWIVQDEKITGKHIGILQIKV